MTRLAAVLLVVALLTVYATWTAGRLDRLHARVDAAWSALDAALVRRAAAARAVVLLEAMATGTPVVASDLEAFRRVLEDGRCGVLFPVRDAAALAGALADLLADPSRRALLADRGRAAVRPYDWSTVTRQVVDVYETVAAAALVALDHAEVGDDDPADPDDAEPDDADPGALRRVLAQLTGRGGA